MMSGCLRLRGASIRDRDGDHSVAEDRTPLADAAVTGKQDCASLVTLLEAEAAPRGHSRLRPRRLRAASDFFRRVSHFTTTTAHRAGSRRLLCMGLFSQF